MPLPITQPAKPHHYMLQSSNGILGVIQPNLANRGSIRAIAQEMMNGRMAMALRKDRTQAVEMALADAYRRHRRETR